MMTMLAIELSRNIKYGKNLGMVQYFCPFACSSLEGSPLPKQAKTCPPHPPTPAAHQPESIVLVY